MVVDTIIGVDEVGTGAWAGPLVVCAFAAPTPIWDMHGLRDSKKLSRQNREIHARSLGCSFPGKFVIVEGSSEDIHIKGLHRVLTDAMEEAILTLINRIGPPNRVIIDGVAPTRPFLGAEYYPKADGTYPCVMAASVLAKVYRDDLMYKAAKQFPGYDFENNVGYGTPKHIEALKKLGTTKLHKRCYTLIEQRLKEGSASCAL